MKTIVVKNKVGESYRINAPLEKPETDQEREDAAVAEGLLRRGFKPVKEDVKAKEEA